MQHIHLKLYLLFGGYCFSLKHLNNIWGESLAEIINNNLLWDKTNGSSKVGFFAFYDHQAWELENALSNFPFVPLNVTNSYSLSHSINKQAECSSLWWAHHNFVHHVILMLWYYRCQPGMGSRIKHISASRSWLKVNHLSISFPSAHDINL